MRTLLDSLALPIPTFFENATLVVHHSGVQVFKQEEGKEEEVDSTAGCKVKNTKTRFSFLEFVFHVSSSTNSPHATALGRRLNGFLGLSLNGRIILFLVSLLVRTVSV